MKFAILAASGVATILVGCSKTETDDDSSDDSFTIGGKNAIICNNIACPTDGDYCCGGTPEQIKENSKLLKCIKVADVHSGLQCGFRNDGGVVHTKAFTQSGNHINDNDDNDKDDKDSDDNA